MTLKRSLLLVAGSAVIPLSVGASTGLETSLVQNGAPISIDRCIAVLRPDTEGKGGYDLSENVDFSNVSQRNATSVGFSFTIVDSIGRTELTLTDVRKGSFAPGMAIGHSMAPPTNANAMSQTIHALPNIAKLLCSVRTVRFDDGSVWNEGDGPAGSATMYTPLPGPTPTTQWQWPYDQPTP